MAIQYTIELITSSLLYVKAKGNDENVKEVKGYTEAIIQKALETKPKYIFCDEYELIYEISITDTFALAEFASTYASQIDKVAIWCNPDFLESGEFYETVSSNRGLTIRISPHKEELIKWLQLTDIEFPE